jgi:hypothetical protein
VYCTKSPLYGYITGNGTIAVCGITPGSFEFTNCVEAIDSNSNPFQSTYGIITYNENLYVIDGEAGNIFSCMILTELSGHLQCTKLQTYPETLKGALNIDIYNNMAYITSDSRVWECPINMDGSFANCTCTSAIMNGSYGIKRFNNQVYVTTYSQIANFQVFENNTLADIPSYSSLQNFKGTEGISCLNGDLLVADDTRIAQCKTNPRNGIVEFCYDGISLGNDLVAHGICSFNYKSMPYVQVATDNLDTPLAYCVTDDHGVLSSCKPYSCGIRIYSYDMAVYFYST